MTLPADAAPNRNAAISFWLLIGLIAGFGASKAVLSDTLDPDLFWHLRVADQLRAQGIGPIVDQLSFSSIKEPWTPYSWLAELGMKWVWDHLGWRGTVVGECILIAGVIIAIALACTELAGDGRRLNCVLATMFAAYLVIPFISFRPVSMAMLLLALCAWLLLRDRRRRTASVWIIIPLTVVTANIHLCVVFVPIWTGCLLAGAIWERKDIQRYVLLFAATAVAALLTPMLPGALSTAWFYQSKDVIVANPEFIAEMRPVWAGVGGKVTMALAAAITVCAILRRDRLRCGERLWFVTDGGLMFRLAKFVPMFAMIAAPVFAATGPTLSDRVLRKPTTVAALAVFLLLAIIRTIASFPGGEVAMDTWMNRHRPAFPAAAANYVEANVTPRSKRLINEFNWGGYLGWRLGDRYQVFLDGRTQLFPSPFWQKTYLGTDQEAAGMIRAADADVAVIPKTKSHFRNALEILGWRRVYSDDIAEVFLPPS